MKGPLDSRPKHKPRRASTEAAGGWPEDRSRQGPRATIEAYDFCFGKIEC
jgi:hypothetical protein